MKEYLRNLVKIVFFGNFLISTVHCNGYLPSASFYQEDPYYASDFVQPYTPPLPAYYSDSNFNPVPLPYENYYSPLQTLLRNTNYQPVGTLRSEPTYSNHHLNYYPPQSPYYTRKSNYKSAQSHDSEFKNYKVSVNKNTGITENGDPVFTEDINIASKRQNTPLNYDDFNSYYPDEEYSENFSDETPPLVQPCNKNKPYQHFQPTPTYENTRKPHCKPRSKPHDIDDLRAPITVLPPTFPPKLEEFLQKIQNLLSTYSELETKKPQLQQTTNISPPIESETVLPSESEENQKTITEETGNGEFHTGGESIIMKNAEKHATSVHVQESQESKEEIVESSAINHSESHQSLMSHTGELHSLNSFNHPNDNSDFGMAFRSETLKEQNKITTEQTTTEAIKKAEDTTTSGSSTTTEAIKKAEDTTTSDSSTTTEAIKKADDTTTSDSSTTTEAIKKADDTTTSDSSTTTEAIKKAEDTTTSDSSTTTEAIKKAEDTTTSDSSTTTEAKQRVEATTTESNVKGEGKKSS